MFLQLASAVAFRCHFLCHGLPSLRLHPLSNSWPQPNSVQRSVAQRSGRRGSRWRATNSCGAAKIAKCFRQNDDMVDLWWLVAHILNNCIAVDTLYIYILYIYIYIYYIYIYYIYIIGIHTHIYIYVCVYVFFLWLKLAGLYSHTGVYVLHCKVDAWHQILPMTWTS